MSVMGRVAAVGTPVSSNTTTIQPAWPAGTRKGQIGLCFVVNPNNGVALTTANGFAAITGAAQGTGVAGTGTSTGHDIFWCRATTNNPSGPVITFPGGFHQAVIVTFDFFVESGNPWDIVSGDVDAVGATAFTIPTATSSVNNGFAVAIVTSATDIGTDEIATFGGSNLVNLAKVAGMWSTVGNGGGFGIFAGELATAGATGTVTGTLVTSSKQSRTMIVFKPRRAPAVVGVGVRAAWSAAHAGEEANTVAWWTGTKAGDVGVMFRESEDDRDATFSDLAGFQFIGKFGVGGSNKPASTRIGAWYARADAGVMALNGGHMPDVVPVQDDDPLDPNQRHWIHYIVSVRGCADASDPLHGFAGDTLDVDQTTFTVPGVTTTDDDCLILAALAHTYDIAANATSGWTNANLPDLNEEQNQFTSFGKGGGIAVASGALATHGASGSTTGSVAFSNTPNEQAQARICIALTPKNRTSSGAKHKKFVGPSGII